MNGKIVNDKYRIDDLIGVGGMAKVYRAHDLTTGDIVAIKFLKEENQQNAEYVRRFEREAQAGMTLNHPNIVKLLDTGVEEGVNYIVFEYVNGPTLKDYIIKHGKFSPKAAVNIIGHILDSIGYAHEHGIIHRDVKPQNVIITSNGTVKLADFGIARLMNASTRSFTGIGAMGSVHYISPEQAEGKETNYQTDLYSVGIILYEMLTGQVPFDNVNEVSVAVMHIKEKLRAPIELNREISYSLNSVILKSAAKDLKLRYTGAAEMKNDLLRALRDPDGTFADLPMPDKSADDDDEYEEIDAANMVGKLNRGVFGAAIALVSCIVVMIGAFIVIRATYKPTVAVHNLIDMTLAEAETTVGKNFELDVQRESSEKTPGLIISQDPVEGARLKKGSTITIVISIGSEHVVSPDMKNMNVTDANALLQKSGLFVGEVVYTEDTDVLPGLVCSQKPAADEEIKLNTGFTLYVSGKPAKLATMPDVTDTNIKAAVKKLTDSGFQKIMVRCITDSSAKEDTIVSQGLDTGITVDTSVFVFLSVNTTHGEAKAEGACTLTKDIPVLVTIDTGEGYEVVVYENAKNDSTVVPYTAYLDNEGTFDCIVYESGVEIKRSGVNFSKKD